MNDLRCGGLRGTMSECIQRHNRIPRAGLITYTATESIALRHTKWAARCSRYVHKTTSTAPVSTQREHKMPTVEDYFDDDTDLPLPSSSSKPRGLGGSGLRGALLEEINDDEEMEMDYDKLADQGRGIFGENATAPAPAPATPGRADKGKMIARDDDDGMRPVGTPGGQGPMGMPKFDPNSPMGGFMGDMMKLQQAEDERMERLKKQFGSTTIADSSAYKQ